MSYFDRWPDDPPEGREADEDETEQEERERDEWYAMTPAQRRQEMGGEYGGDGADD